MLPVEAFATRIKILISKKCVLDRLIVPSEVLDCLIFTGQRSDCSPAFLIH